MKRIKKLSKSRQMSKLMLIVLLICIGFNLRAQITISQDDMPVAYDAIRTSSAFNFDQYDFEETGENFNWDFSELESISQAVDTFVRVTDTPLLYWPFFLISANLARPLLEDSPLPELPLSDVYNFYNSSANNYRDVGFAAMVSGLPLPFAFDEPDIIYDFPMNYGNVDSSESGYGFGLPDIAYILVERTRVNTVDGWGTLSTPYGTFDVLRMRSDVTEYDSIYIDSLNVGLPINREYTEYKWLGKGQKIPLLSVTDDLLSLVVNYVDSLRVDVVDVQDMTKPQVSQALVYPNPSKGIVSIEIPVSGAGKVEMYLYDLSGNLISSFLGGDYVNKVFRNSIDMNSLNLSQGQYLLRIRNGNKQYVNKLIYQPD